MRRLERILAHEACSWLTIVVAATLVLPRQLALLAATSAFIALRLAFDVARYSRRRAARRAHRQFLDDSGSTRGRP